MLSCESCCVMYAKHQVGTDWFLSFEAQYMYIYTLYIRMYVRIKQIKLQR